MAVEINMIKVGLTMKTGTVTKWLKKEGDVCVKGESVAEMETDKITNEIPAPADGVLLKIVANENKEVPVGDLLGYIGQPGEEIPDTAAPAATSAASETAAPAAAAGAVKSAAVAKSVRISPAARKLAEEKGVDVSAVNGTGPGGRITVQDVEKAAEAPASTFAAANACASDEFELVPYAGMRKAIGENMSQSWATAPRVTHHCRADMSRLIALRAELNANSEKADRISVTDLLVVLAAKALADYPKVNASLCEEGIKRFKMCNIGVAVALDEGLVVPVVHDVGSKSLYEVSREIKELAGKARNKGLLPGDMSGGTFTITNLGMYRSVEFFSPIINQPESAILGVGKTVETPVAVDGAVAIRPMIGLSLTFDHRLIDGSVAAEFLESVIDNIENPAKSLLT